MNYFISYDIKKNRYRSRTAKVLLKYGAVRVQKSVFFIFEAAPFYIKELKEKITVILEEADDTDSVLLIKVEKDWLNKVSIIGENEAYKDSMKIYHTKFF